MGAIIIYLRGIKRIASMTYILNKGKGKFGKINFKINKFAK